MARLRFYLETSVWSFFDYDRDPVKMAATRRFFREVEAMRLRIAISDLVLAEVRRTPNEPRRDHLESLIAKFHPELILVTPEVEALAAKYVLQGTLPERASDDARHLASAVVHGVDVVVNWNMRHMVRLKIKREVNAANLLNGYGAVEILTPEEAT